MNQPIWRQTQGPITAGGDERISTGAAAVLRAARIIAETCLTFCLITPRHPEQSRRALFAHLKFAQSVKNPGWEIDVMGMRRSTASRTVLMRPSPRLYDPAPTPPCRAGARLTQRQVKVNRAASPHL
ncbi:unnamed protein product [Boreogadus saida]